MPRLANPSIAVDKTIDVPGTFWAWSGEGADANKAKTFACSVVEFSGIHQWDGPQSPSAAFHLAIQDTDGIATAETCWMAYPKPFLDYYFATFPAENPLLPQVQPQAGSPSMASVAATDANASTTGTPLASGSQAEAAPVAKRGVYLYVSDEPISAERITTGSMTGKFRKVYRCEVVKVNGQVCGQTLTIAGSTTSGAITHFRAKAATCPAHAEALEMIEAHNPRTVEIAGVHVTCFNFKESFPHHVRFVYMLSEGVAAEIRKKPTFKDYIHGFEPRAVMPHHTTITRIAQCIVELQDEAQARKIRTHQLHFKSLKCLGLQLDMWTDTDTHICYGAIMWTHIASSTHSQALHEEVLEFEQFPFTSHTGQNIKTWFEAALQRKGIQNSCISGITPDGAADGQCAFWLMEELSELVDTCYLHQLQRAVLYSIGLTGKPNRNPGVLVLMKCHRRIVQLNNQSRHVNDDIRDIQIAAGIPLHKLWCLVTTCATRWGNQYNQVHKNCSLRPVLEPAILKFKRENRRDDPAITEVDDDGKSNTVTTSQIGLSSEQYEESLQLEAHLKYAYEVKETIEKVKTATPAQAYQLLKNVRDACDAPLHCLDFPATARLQDRQRKEQPEATLPASLSPSIRIARKILQSELDERIFGSGLDERPSESRLVGIYMSKQVPASQVLPGTLVPVARALYMGYLQRATVVVGQPAHTPNNITTSRTAPRSANTARPAPHKKIKTSLFSQAAASPQAQQASAWEIEATGWASLPQQTVQRFVDCNTGLLDEFALVFSVRAQFPLHYTVFQQTACHSASEGNAETLFALSKNLTDPNMYPSMLIALTKIRGNKHAYKPAAKDVMERYYQKYGESGTQPIDSDCDSE